MIVFTSYSSYRSCPSHGFGHQVVTNGGPLALTACDYVKSNQARRNSEDGSRAIEYYWGNDLSGTEQDAGGVGGLLATRIDGVFYVPVYGANGNVMMYVDATGAIAAQFDYDPYGRALAAPNYWENLWNFAFSTKYHDWETALVAYQLRTYDPVHGRWLNRDPIEEEDADDE